MAEIKAVEQPVCDHAVSRGYHTRKVVWQGRRGAPDRLFYGNDESFFVEFKDYGKGPDAHQWREIARMRNNGIPVYVIDTKEQGCALFDSPVSSRLDHAIKLWPTPPEFISFR